MTERFKKVYSALVRAFYEGTLVAGSCRACAVGNIVADAISLKLKKEDVCEQFLPFPNTNWMSAIKCIPSTIIDKLWGKQLTKEELFNMTGYSGEELAEVEKAFENNTKLKVEQYALSTEQKILEDQYNGLCAVVDVLLELDNIKPEEHYKQKFAEHPKLQLN